MDKINTVIFEEHNESFICWYKAISDKIINEQNNFLLHIDHHSDFKMSPFRKIIPYIHTPIKDVQDFTYEELRLSTFIIPAIYRKIFKEYCWLIPRFSKIPITREKLNNKEHYDIRSFNNEEKILILKKVNKNESHTFTSCTLSTEYNFKTDLPIVLDIDIDYFCCSKIIDQCQKLEITKEEYDKCKNEKYRKINLFYCFYLKEENNKYYIYLNPNPTYSIVENNIDTDIILKSIIDFVDFLKKNNINPQFITISRSRYSGFTPEKHWQFIENKLLEKMHEIFNLDVKMMNDFI